SALKRNGVPLYTLARRGQEVERPPREVTIHEIMLKGFDPPRFEIEIFCSRGLYVRVLAEEIGDMLGIPAHLYGLVRTQIGHFDIRSAVSDEAFDRLADREKPGYSLSEALQHLPAVELTATQSRELDSGITPRVGKIDCGNGDLIRLLRPRGELGGIAEVNGAGLLKLKRVFSAEGGQRTAAGDFA
ncbi:MAG: tRNA pseudouridine(55) synthase TruB, partial [Candidatus Krumholzibacteriota bacterium]|nr:tRNA pseudouridine(55) synthase TruB [Candidatus Krumholzibacteriota bacterium]